LASYIQQVAVVDRVADGGVEDLLFHRRVHDQLVAEPLHQRFLPFVVVVGKLLVIGEKGLHRLVIRGEQSDGIEGLGRRCSGGFRTHGILTMDAAD
jgi:hypothetical protein